MQAASQLAFPRDTRPNQLRHPVVVGCKQTQPVLDLGAHFGRTALRAEQPNPQFQVLPPVSQLMRQFP